MYLIRMLRPNRTNPGQFFEESATISYNGKPYSRTIQFAAEAEWCLCTGYLSF